MRPLNARALALTVSLTPSAPAGGSCAGAGFPDGGAGPVVTRDLPPASSRWRCPRASFARSATTDRRYRTSDERSRRTPLRYGSPCDPLPLPLPDGLAARALPATSRNQPHVGSATRVRARCPCPSRGHDQAAGRRAGRRSSPATMPGFHARRPPRNNGLRYRADPPRVAESVAVLRAAGDGLHGRRLQRLDRRPLARVGLRVQEALSLAERDLDPPSRIAARAPRKGGRPRSRHG